MSLTQLRDGHREMLLLLNAIIDAVGGDAPANEIANARRSLSQAVARHMALKQAVVIAPLQQSPCEAHRELGRKLTASALAMRQASIEHHAKWPLAAIQANPREYRMTLRGLVRAFEKHFSDEERQVHPVAAAAVQARGTARAA